MIRLLECQGKTWGLPVEVKYVTVSEREKERQRGREGRVAISAAARIVGGERGGKGGRHAVRVCVCPWRRLCVRAGCGSSGGGAREQSPPLPPPPPRAARLSHVANRCRLHFALRFCQGSVEQLGARTPSLLGAGCRRGRSTYGILCITTSSALASCQYRCFPLVKCSFVFLNSLWKKEFS